MVKYTTMRTRIWMLALGIGAAASLHAQGMGEIHGRVLETDGPSLGAVVVATQGERRVGTVTDDDGKFVLKPLLPGVWTVTASMMGMRSEEVSGVEVLPENNSYVKDLLLVPAEIGGVVVTKRRWEKPMIDHDNTGVTKITPVLFKNSPLAKNPVKMVSAFTPGVYQSPNGDGLFFRGSRSENMCYFVDGVKLGARLSGVPNDAISSMSVYTGGLPARYGDVTGGVVAIETKSYFDLYQQRNAGVR